MLMKIGNLFKRDNRQVEHKIFSCSIHDDVEILGQVFHGLQDICAQVEMSQAVGSSCKPSVREPKKTGRVHVGELWMSYPCFDSSDYLYENRTYQNYILRERPITFEDMERLRKLPSGMNAQRLSPSVPEDMLPMVYYVGDGDTMIVGV
jgi:hypothetical protein